jgi:hypothetical protein
VAENKREKELFLRGILKGFSSNRKTFAAVSMQIPSIIPSFVYTFVFSVVMFCI